MCDWGWVCDNSVLCMEVVGFPFHPLWVGWCGMIQDGARWCSMMCDDMDGAG